MTNQFNTTAQFAEILVLPHGELLWPLTDGPARLIANQMEVQFAHDATTLRAVAGRAMLSGVLHHGGAEFFADRHASYLGAFAEEVGSPLWPTSGTSHAGRCAALSMFDAVLANIHAYIREPTAARRYARASVGLVVASVASAQAPGAPVLPTVITDWATEAYTHYIP